MPDKHGSALHQHRGTRAVQRLVEYAPSTGGLALWVGHHDRPPEEDAPVVATDGRHILYATAFEALPVPLQAGHVAHEVLHIALRHTQRFGELQQLLGDVDLQLFNICADAIVNSTLGHLSWLALPEDAVRLETLLQRALRMDMQSETALLQWDVERLYRAIDDRRAAGGRGPRQEGAHQGQANAARPDGPNAAAARALAQSHQRDLVPGARDSHTPEAEAELAREWAERLLRAHAGDGAHSLLRTLLADLPRTHTPWEQVLRSQLARALAPKRSLSWSRPSRSYIANQGRSGSHHRMPFEPGQTPSKRVPRLVVVVDVSGSIEDALMARFAREIDAITRRLEAGLVLVIGDDQVRSVLHCPPGHCKLRDVVFAGGGGTDFTPLLQEAARHGPDSVVVLTDLEGPARYKPACPVIWAVPEAHQAAIEPFGRKLVLR